MGLLGAQTWSASAAPLGERRQSEVGVRDASLLRGSERARVPGERASHDDERVGMAVSPLPCPRVRRRKHDHEPLGAGASSRRSPGCGDRGATQ